MSVELHRHDLAVDGHASRRDHFLGLAARRDAGRSEESLQSKRLGHRYSESVPSRSSIDVRIERHRRLAIERRHRGIVRRQLAVTIARIGRIGRIGRARNALGPKWHTEAIAHDLTALGCELAVLAERRQLAQIAEAEEIEKLLRRAVEDRPADLLALAEHADQRAIEQQAERRRRIDAADLVDLGARDRLAIRHDRERLELRARQPHRPARDQLLHPRRVARIRPELIAPRDLLERDSAVAILVGELREGLLEAPHVADPRQLAKSLERDRPIGGEDQRLDEVPELAVVHRRRAGRQRAGLGTLAVRLGCQLTGHGFVLARSVRIGHAAIGGFVRHGRD